MCTETVMWKENGSKVHFEGVFWGYKWAIAGSAAGAVTQPPAWFCPIHDTEACHSLPSLEGSSYWKCHRLFWFVCGTVCLCNVKHLHTLVFNRTPHGFFMHYFGRLCLNYPVHSGWPKENVVTLVIIKNKIKKNNVCVKDSLITFKTPINLPFTFFFSHGGLLFKDTWVWEAFCSSRWARWNGSKRTSGAFHDLERQGGFDQSNIFTIFACTNSGDQKKWNCVELKVVAYNVVRQWGRKCWVLSCGRSLTFLKTTSRCSSLMLQDNPRSLRK